MRLLTVLSVTLAVATGVLVSAGVARAQPYFDVLHSFPADNAAPAASLIQATDGNFYGTTSGGASGRGTVFKMAPDGTVTVLHEFTGDADGAFPQTSLIQATDGSFYGTTPAGGGAGCFGVECGTVFQITPGGTLTVLHAFTGGSDGAGPVASLIQATDGNFYGTTEVGGGTGCAGIGCGTVFRMTPRGTVTVLHAFTFGTDGAFLSASLIQATDGNFYGTTSLGGGPCDCGTIFRVTLSGTFSVLHVFNGADGILPYGYPQATLMQATDGNFYGTTASGGPGCSGGGCGTVFQMTPTGTLTVLHAFTGGSDGAGPLASLIQAADGNFYGTTEQGGVANLAAGTVAAGTVFRMTPAGTVTVLHVFSVSSSDYPRVHPSSLIQATDGNFYGTTQLVGAFDWGTVFRISASPAGSMSLTANFDGDPKSDLVIYRPNTGIWDIRHSSSGYSYPTLTSVQWGLPGDRPLVADFDGDGKTDIAVYRPSNGGWYILWSSTNYATYSAYLWGLAGDQPVPADYDGDGKADIAVYRPSSGGWYILWSRASYATYGTYLWGLAGDKPVPADYDGDGKADLAVYRPSTGGWYVLQSSGGNSTYVSYLWGLDGDVPVTGDFDGDGKTDIAVYRPSTGGWYILQSGSHYASYVSCMWGLSGDVPVPGDLDGDRKTDLIVYRPSNGTWYVLFSSSNAWSSY
jgi:uncharacterized repeat protein (TIGR03803 family)